MKRLLLLQLSLLMVICANAQTTKTDTAKKEGFAVAEFGGAASHDLKGGGGAYGYNIAVEVTPIEDWLELELGVSPVFGNHFKETDVDLLFKKPWTFSPKAEFMLGLGLSYNHAVEDNVATNSLAGEVALDFMFWPGGKHRFGWYLEPAYEYGLSNGHEQSLGMSAGLLISIP